MSLTREWFHAQGPRRVVRLTGSDGLVSRPSPGFRRRDMFPADLRKGESAF
jgi:hypothetical protein